MKTTIDRNGKVKIPKKVREDLGLETGMVLQIEEVSGEVRLRPASPESIVVNRGGVPVHHGRALGDVEGTLNRMRAERDRLGLNLEVREP